ncbi:glycosyltransferase family 4 protein [Sphingomonas sp. Leaf22]|uniref:glycosyltransferase family 4 protein n=1 Tax=Sphingomonas sp. Leaf22 TaxID=1735687 RepID=UPI000AC9DA74|nr:glycosyltransferase family 1 protein [Sphingomonas sp. Leaf22]
MIGFSFLGLAPDHLSGIGRYSVALFEAIVVILGDTPDQPIVAFVPVGSEHHFSDAARAYVKPLPLPHNAVARIAYEQLVFPIVLRRTGVRTLLNASFTGPLFWGGDMVTVIHDLFYHIVPAMVRSDRRMYLKTLVPPTMRRSRAIIVVSHNTGRDVARTYPDIADRVVVVPLACRPMSRSARLETMPSDCAMMVSTITANKNPGLFVAALKLLRTDHNWACGMIVGNDPEGLAATAIAAHDAAHIVEQRHHVSDKELTRLYANALAVVIPSYYEGFGLPVLEAQAMGVPVLCSDRGSLPEVAGDGALFFDPDDPDALAQAIDTVRNDRGTRRRLIDAGTANVAKYSWERTARDTLAVLCANRKKI